MLTFKFDRAACAAEPRDRSPSNAVGTCVLLGGPPPTPEQAQASIPPVHTPGSSNYCHERCGTSDLGHFIHDAAAFKTMV